MSSYYLKIPHGIEQFRLVGVTGRNSSGLLRVVEVGPTGLPTGEGYTWVTPNPAAVEMKIGPQGFLIESDDTGEEEIDWEAHEVDSEYIGPNAEENEPSVSPSNPAMGAYPELL